MSFSKSECLPAQDDEHSPEIQTVKVLEGTVLWHYTFWHHARRWNVTLGWSKKREYLWHESIVGAGEESCSITHLQGDVAYLDDLVI